MRKSINTVKEEAVKYITGIENLELFIDEEDEWNFHDSEIRSIHWDDKTRILDVTVEPMGYSPKLPEDGPDKSPRLDFHFHDVVEINLQWNTVGFIFELDITEKNGFLVCYFDSYTMVVTSSKLVIDKPRFVSKSDF